MTVKIITANGGSDSLDFGCARTAIVATVTGTEVSSGEGKLELKTTTGGTSAAKMTVAANGLVTVANDLTVSGKTTLASYAETVVAVGNSGTAKTLSLAAGTVQTVTLTGNCTFTMPATTAGMSFTLLVFTGDGDFTGTFTDVKFPANTAPTITTTASRWDLLSFISEGNHWFGSYIQAFQ
jgi:hypothetical protein